MGTRLRTYALLYAAAVIATMIAGAGPSLAQARGLFASLLGTWSGTAKVVLQDGRTDQILCNAYYSGGASQLGMVVRCKSSTQSIEMRSRLTDSSGHLTGHWEERTYNAEGDVSGTLKGNRISLAISGAVSGTMVVDLAERRHTVTINVSGTALKSVTVALQRS